jgi:hypothetical protein
VVRPSLVVGHLANLFSSSRHTYSLPHNHAGLVFCSVSA